MSTFLPKPLFFLKNTGERRIFKPKLGGSTKKDLLIQRHYKEHGKMLLEQFNKAQELVYKQNGEECSYHLTLEIPANASGVVDSLATKSSGMMVTNVASSPDREILQVSALFPHNSKASDYFRTQIEKYSTEDTTQYGWNSIEKRISAINSINLSTLKDLFQGKWEDFPSDSDRVVSWELWLINDLNAIPVLQRLAQQLSISVSEDILEFTDRKVISVSANTFDLQQLVLQAGCVAQVRIRYSPVDLLSSLGRKEAIDWSEELKNRIDYSRLEEHSPAVCVLDSGVWKDHPLITQALSEKDWQTVDGQQGQDGHDHNGHGTCMAGLALYGDLTALMSGQQRLSVEHCLESVKIHFSQKTPLDYQLLNGSHLSAVMLRTGVALAEYAASSRKRVFLSPLSDNAESNYPSSWSAELDQLSHGGDENYQRLFIVSAGNIDDIETCLVSDYPQINDRSVIANPGQAWNVLTVGAITEQVNIDDISYAGWQALSPSGDLSPSSRTSVDWNDEWPIKPDVVFEGGNSAFDPLVQFSTSCWIKDLSLLSTSTSKCGHTKHYEDCGETSASSALIANLATRLLVEFPDLSPQSIRALLVHSAEWTEAMLKHLPKNRKAILKEDYKLLLRRYGYGVPSFKRAISCMDNHVTLVVQDEIVPFKKSTSKSNDLTLNEMILHSFPWPTESLKKISDQTVKMKVTLSYFIEPNPGSALPEGLRARSYKSYGLRFEVKHALEKHEDFLKRINRAERNDAKDWNKSAEEGQWLIGTNIRNKGSIHSDVWTGSAGELAARDSIAIIPVAGWWRTSKKQDFAGRKIQYSLIISLEANNEVDLYTEIANKVKVPIEWDNN